MKLYNFDKSSAAHRVRIAANLKGIELVLIDVDLFSGAQRNPDYAGVNPMQMVPTLIDGDHVMTQSLAIIDHFEGRVPEPPLYPADPAARAQALAMALTVGCDMAPLGALRVAQQLKARFDADDGTVRAWRQAFYGHGFQALEIMVSMTGCQGQFCVGERPTVADVMLVPQLAVARRFGVDVASYERLLEIETRCLEIEAFSRAAPA